MSFAHLRHLRTLLEGVHTAFYDAELRVKTCQRSLDEARAALNIAELETRTLARSRDGLQRAISQAMRTVQYGSMLPDELLSLVLAHAAAESAAISGAAGIDRTLATLPCTLRLVCKRWDAVALTTRELWTYVAIPATLKVACGPGLTALPAHLALQLARSGNLPLAVVIDAQFYYTSDRGPGARDTAISIQQELLRKVFDVFATPRTAARIRTLEVHGGPPKLSRERHFSSYGSSYNNIRHLTMGLLRLPTPILEEAHLIMDYEDCESNEPWINPPSVPQPVYFPVAPKLRLLNLAYVPMLCSPPHPGLPSLHTLWITFRIMYKDHIQAMLSLCPALREIDASVDDFETDPPPGTTSADEDVLLAAPTVKIGPEACSASFLRYVSLDNVTSLSISTWQLLEIEGLHARLAHTLTELRLQEPGELDQTLIGPLGVFSLLTDVAFLTDSAELGPLVDCLCRDDAPMWPRLTNLSIVCPVGEHGGAELVRLAQHRASSAGDRWAELGRITVKETEIANWVAVQLRSILGDEKVILVDRVP